MDYVNNLANNPQIYTPYSYFAFKNSNLFNTSFIKNLSNDPEFAVGASHFWNKAKEHNDKINEGLFHNNYIVLNIKEHLNNFLSFNLPKEFYASLNAFSKKLRFDFWTEEHYHVKKRNRIMPYNFLSFLMNDEELNNISNKILKIFHRNITDYTENKNKKWFFDFNFQKFFYGLADKPNFLKILGFPNVFNLKWNKDVYFYDPITKTPSTVYDLKNNDIRKENIDNLSLFLETYNNSIYSSEISEKIIELRKILSNQKLRSVMYKDFYDDKLNIYANYSWYIIRPVLQDLNLWIKEKVKKVINNTKNKIKVKVQELKYKTKLQFVTLKTLFYILNFNFYDQLKKPFKKTVYNERFAYKMRKKWLRSFWLFNNENMDICEEKLWLGNYWYYKDYLDSLTDLDLLTKKNNIKKYHREFLNKFKLKNKNYYSWNSNNFKNKFTYNNKNTAVKKSFSKILKNFLAPQDWKFKKKINNDK